MYLVNTFLGFLIAQLYGILTRGKTGKFDLVYFIKDTWQKILLSLALSVLISIAVNLNYEDVFILFNSEMTVINNLIYLVIGAVPEVVLQVLRKRFGVLYSANQQSSIGGGGTKVPPPKNGKG